MITADNELDPDAPVLAYHVSQLRPFELATEVQTAPRYTDDGTGRRVEQMQCSTAAA